MNRIHYNTKSLHFWIVVAFVVAIIFVLVIAMLSPSYNSATRNGTALSFNEGWLIEKDGGGREHFTGFGQQLDQNKVTLVHAHDEALNSIDALGFYNYYSAVEIYVGPRLIYSYGSIDDLNNHVNLGNYYSMVDIHRHEMAESEIKIVFMNNNPLTIYGFMGGTGGALEMALVNEYIVTLLTPLVSIVFLIVTVFLRARKATRDLITPTHRWLLIFSLLASVWELADSQILMDMGFSAGGVCLMSFEVFMLLPIPLLIFTSYSCRKHRKLDYLMCIIVFCNFVILNILNFTHVKDFLYSLTSTHIVVLCSLVLCFIQMLLECKSKPSSSSILLFAGFVVFAVSALIQYLDFFVDPTGSNTRALQVGILIFMILQFGMIIYSVNQRTNQIVARLESQTRLLKTRFKSFVPDDIIQQRLDKGENIAKTGEHKYLTVLESDIRGFSDLIQNMTAEGAIDMLNHYLENMTSIITRQNGLCLEFVGDAIVALFDEEHAGEKHSEKAVIAAVQMQYIMNDINEWNKKHGFPSFDMGIGIHTGNAYVGYIGSESRMEYDAIGSTINLVSRIEHYSTGGQILISEECKNNVSLNLNIARSFTIHPKGHRGGLEVYQIVGLGDPYNISSSTIEQATKVLKTPINLSYNMIIDKSVGETKYQGSIIEVSRTNAILRTTNFLDLYDNLKFNYKDDFTCKVISKSERGILLRFTSTPPDFAMNDNEERGNINEL